MTDTTMPTFTTSDESTNPSTGSSSSETHSGTEISTLTGSLATETPISSATLSSDTTNTRTSVSTSATDTSSLVVIYPSSTSTTNTVTSTTLPPTYSLSDATSSALSTAPVSFSSSETITPNPSPTETTGTTEIVSDTVTSTSPPNSTVSSASLYSTFTVSVSGLSSTLSLSSSSDVDSASISTTTLISSFDSVTPYPNATFSTLFSETSFSATSLSTTSLATLPTTTSGLLTFTSIPTTSSTQTFVLISENLSTAVAISTVTMTGVASESASGLTSAPTSKPVEVVMTATPSASIASGLETLTELTTEFTTSTLPDGQLTTIPTHTGTTTIVTPSPTGKIEPNPILRNKAAVVGVIIAGVLVIVGGILVLLYALQKRKKRVVWRTKSPDKPYTERPGRVLIRGHSPDAVNFRRPLADQEWQPPLISEVGEDLERDDEDEQLYFQGPMTLPMVQKEEYGSIMGAVHSYGLVGNDDLESSLSSSSIGLRLPKAGGDEIGRLISFEENNETISPTATQAGEFNHGWVQADVSTPTDPFVDPDPDPNSSYSAMRSPGTLKYRPLSQSSSVGGTRVFSPSLSQLSSPTRAIPDRLRGGTNDSIMGLSSSPVNDTLPFNPYTDLNHSSRPSSLLNPPIRPKFIGTLTDLVLNSSKSFSEPPTLPPIPPVASPSPGESMDSYHPDGLLDPALLESRSLQSTDSGSRIGREPSSESLVDHVDYTRPISSIIFHQPPTIESYMEGVEEEDRELNAHAEMDGSAAVRAYHDKLLGSRRNS
ncbi:hypothetical protein GGU11DRAFT_771060 [Lentinula aff. detonsa]|nr:hypothetical protein GGU11DRAFT_771060 [Lentinula aff. detonsa]